MKILVTLFVGALLAITASAKDIVVSPGDSLEKARDAARAGDRIILRGGTYRLGETLVIGPQNSGVTWMAAPGETPVLSGGGPVTGWTPDTKGVWKAHLDRTEKLRQLYVNGMPARMAELKTQVRAKGPYGQFTITGQEPWAFCPGKAADGVRFEKADLPAIAHPEDLEIRSRKTWTMNRVAVRKVIEDGNDGVFLFEQPMGAFGQNLDWNAGFNMYAIELFNAREFLTQPGEFYFDRSAQTLYYMPRPGEVMNKTEVIAPVLETLVSIKGENLKTHVSNVSFQGITFAHTAWQLMDVAGSHGACGIQSCALTVKWGSANWHDDRYQTTDLPVAAVEVNSADHIAFKGDDFEMTGAIGLNLENDVTDSTVEGNVLHDIGSCSINVGHPQQVYIGKQNGDNEGHGPYNIDNRRVKWNEQVEGLCTDILIANNLIRRTGIEHPPSVALSVFYGHGIHIEHNDLRYAPYSGIGLGWGWEIWNDTGDPHCKPSLSLRNNDVRWNRIGNMLQTLSDGGGIYLLGMSQPLAKNPAEQKWTEVSENYIHDFGRNACAGIHPDNGARFFHFYENVFDHLEWALIKVSAYASKGNFILEHNFTNTPLIWTDTPTWPIAPNTTFKDNVQVPDGQWPEEARKVIENSGLEPAYQYLFDRLPKVETSLAKTKWKIVSASSEGGPGGLAARAIDGDPGTLWHTLTPAGPQPPPQNIIVDIGESHELTGFTYLPRQDSTTVGNVTQYTFYVSDDAKTWGEPAAQGNFSDMKTNPLERKVEFNTPVKGRYFKFVALAAEGNMVAVPELGVLALER